MSTQPPSTKPLPPLGSVLVTGGCGFLGSHIVSQILERYSAPSTTVHVIDLKTSRNVFPGAHYHEADLTSVQSMRAVFEAAKPAVVIHTASPTPQHTGGKARKRAEEMMRKVNVEGTEILVEEARRVGCEVFVYTSSASVISDTVQDLLNADEKYAYVRGKMQKEYYSDTKAEAEEFVLSSNTRPTPTSATTFLTTALRPSAMFGEQDVQMIPNMIDVLKQGRTNFQLGDGNNLFDYTYVGNAAHAHLVAAARLLELARAFKAKPPPVSTPEEDEADELRVDGRPFIITNASPVYFWDFTRSIWATYARLSSPQREALYPSVNPWVLPRDVVLPIASIVSTITWLLGMPPPTLTPPRVRYACMSRYFRPRRAKLALGYVPRWSLDEGVEKTVKWFVERDQEEAAKKGQ